MGPERDEGSPTRLMEGGAYERIRSALRSQECVLLDGGVTTELAQRHGQDHERLWGIEALASTPDEVLGVHRRYVEAGVHVITTNTWALPAVVSGDGHVEPADGHPVHWMEIARRGVEVARTAIADGGRAGEVAVAFSLNGELEGPEGPETVALLERALASDPPDAILFETLSVIRPWLFDVVEALLKTPIPLWLSFRRCLHGSCGVYGQHWGGPEGDAFGRAARRFEDMGVDALLINCIPPDHVVGMVSHLREFTDMPLGVYPNLGYYTNAGWRTASGVGGDEYAAMARRWRAEGAQIVGGCCGTRPEHIAAAGEALAGTVPGRERHDTSEAARALGGAATSAARAWTSRRGRELHPIDFPAMAQHPGVSPAVAGSLLMWRHLFEESAGAHQRCLDIGCGAGLQTVQLALNGATHVHAIDLDERAVSNTLDNAFRNGVADRVTAEVDDLYPWLPDERYELVVAALPQTPIDPLSELSSHRPTDYWGRGLIDQVIAKLPAALAAEGRALVTLTSLLSRERTVELLAGAGLVAEAVAWELHELPEPYLAQLDHVATVARSSDGYLTHLGDRPLLVTYLLEIRLAALDREVPEPPWVRRR